MGIGLCSGGVTSIFPGIVSDNFGMENQGLNYAIVFIGFSIASYFGPIIAQSVAASNGNDFSKAFFLAIICSVIGIVLTSIMKKVVSINDNKKAY